MSNDIKFEVPTWNQIYDLLLTQAEKIKKSGFKPDTIVAIARGGLVPARILQDLLDIPSIDAIQIEYYVDIAQTRQEPRLKQAPSNPITGKKTLLVDDISDTGKSLKLAKNHLTQQGAEIIKTATIYAKPRSVTTPDFFEKITSLWVVFPWEAKETIRKMAEKAGSKREIEKLVKAGLPRQLAERLLKDMQVN